MARRLRGRRLGAAIGFCCGCGFLLLGYDQGVMGGLVGYDGNTFAKVFDHPRPAITGIMVSIYEIGCLFGALLVLLFGERFGRRKALMVGGSIVVLGTILQVTSYSRAQFIIGRIVAGLGNGINTSTLGVYQSETCTPESRGKLVTVEGIQALCGVMISYWLDFGMSYTNNTAQWRFPIAFQAVFALSMVTVATFLPETPRWLVSHGKNEEAVDVIAALADLPEDHETVLETFNEIAEIAKYEADAGYSFDYREMLGGGEIQNFRRMCLCFGIQFMEEMCGINMITYYMGILFLSTGLSTFMASLLSGVNATVFFLSAWIPILLVDRVGRKPLLIYGAIGMCLTMIVLTITLSRGPNDHAASVCAIVMIFLYEIFFATGGWMATPFLYPSEISTLRLRAKGSAVSVMSKWAFNFLVVMITPVSIANIGWRTYILWAVLNFVFIFIVYGFYPETKGLTLEETDKIFEGGTGIFRGAAGFGARKRHVTPVIERESDNDEKMFETTTKHVERA